MELPTSFVLPDEAVDRLRSQAGKLLRESAAFQKLQQQVRDANAAAISAGPRPQP